MPTTGNILYAYVIKIRLGNTSQLGIYAGQCKGPLGPCVWDRCKCKGPLCMGQVQCFDSTFSRLSILHH